MSWARTGGLRRIDARFVLPMLLATALVFDAGDWAEELASLGVLLDGTDSPVDLIVARADRLGDAVACSSSLLLVTSLARPRLVRDAGYHPTKFLTRPGTDGPAVIFPAGRRGLGRRALAQRAAGRSPMRRARNRLVGGLAIPGAAQGFVVGTRPSVSQELPHILAKALGEAAIPTDGIRWYLDLGDGDELQRAVFHVARASGGPRWIVKFGRVAEARTAFENEERGLALAAATPAIAAHAPQLLCRIDVGGLPVSVETRATGTSLTALLTSRRTRRRKELAVERVAAWILELAASSASPPDTLADERRRLEREVVSRWIDRGAPADLVSRVAPVPGVLQHNDLGTWNIVVTAKDWGIVDWEDAVSPALPLWDVLYFLTDALVTSSRPPSTAAYLDRAVALLRGEHPSSQVLFGWLRKTVDELSIPADSVGPIATLCWLRHGLSHAKRTASITSYPADATDGAPLGQLATRWLADPALGPSWERWR